MSCHVMSYRIATVVYTSMDVSIRTPEEINLRSERARHPNKAVRLDFIFSGFHTSNVPPTD